MLLQFFQETLSHTPEKKYFVTNLGRTVNPENLGGITTSVDDESLNCSQRASKKRG